MSTIFYFHLIVAHACISILLYDSLTVNQLWTYSTSSFFSFFFLIWTKKHFHNTKCQCWVLDFMKHKILWNEPATSESRRGHGALSGKAASGESAREDSVSALRRGLSGMPCDFRRFHALAGITKNPYEYSGCSKKFSNEILLNFGNNSIK